MENIRKDIAAHPRKFLKLIRDTEKATGIPVTANVYARPKPTDNPKLERFFAWKGKIGCVISKAPGPDIFGPELGKRAGEFLQKLIPLYEYFCRFPA